MSHTCRALTREHANKIKPNKALKAAINAISSRPCFKVNCDIEGVKNSYHLIAVLDQVLAEIETYE